MGDSLVKVASVRPEACSQYHGAATTVFSCLNADGSTVAVVYDVIYLHGLVVHHGEQFEGDCL